MNSALEADQAEPTLHDPGTVERRTKACNFNYMSTCSFSLNYVLQSAWELLRHTNITDAVAFNINALSTHDLEISVFYH